MKSSRSLMMFHHLDRKDRPSADCYQFYSLDQLVELAREWLKPSVAPRTRGELVEMLDRAACCNRANETDDDHGRHEGRLADYEGFAWAIREAEKGRKVLIASSEHKYHFAYTDYLPKHRKQHLWRRKG